MKLDRKNKNVFMIDASLIVMLVMLLTLALAYTPGASAATVVNSGTAGSSASLSIVNQNPDPATAGNIVEIRFGVGNTGGNALNNVIVYAVPQYPFSLLPGEDANQTIATLNSYQGTTGSSNTQILSYKFLVDSNVTAGTYDLNMNVDSGDGAVVNKAIPINVANKQIAEIVYIDKTVLIPGQQSDMKFTINNVGSSPLRNIKFSWDNTGNTILPVGSDNTQYIKFLDVGASVDADYKVVADTNAVPGLYALNLHLSYDDALTNQTDIIQTTAGVYVGGTTDFDVAFSETANGQTSFSVANIGSNPATSVAVRIPDQPSWRVTGSNSMIIGNLNKGDYTVASFSLTSNTIASNYSGTGTTGTGGYAGRTGGATGSQATNRTFQKPAGNSQNITVEIDYTDTTGTRQSIMKQLAIGNQISVNSSTTFSRTGRTTTSSLTTYGPYIIAAVILVGLIIYYNSYKKKKLLDPKVTFWNFFRSKKK